MLLYCDSFRSLPTFSIHIVEQLCKNIESSVNTFFRSSDDLLSTNSQNSHLHNRDSIVLVYPPNYIIIVSKNFYFYSFH